MIRGVLSTRILAVLALTTAAVFTVLAMLVRRSGPVVDLDHRVARVLHDYATGHRDQLGPWRAISTVLSPTVLRVVAVAGAVALAWRGRRDAAAFVALAVVATSLLSSVTKAIVDRDRPKFVDPVAHAAAQSYPSGHALTSFVAGAAVLLICSTRVRRMAAAPVAVAVVLVGLSRLVLGVHYLSDVVGGWLLGVAWTSIALLIVRRSNLGAGGRA